MKFYESENKLIQAVNESVNPYYYNTLQGYGFIPIITKIDNVLYVKNNSHGLVELNSSLAASLSNYYSNLFQALSRIESMTGQNNDQCIIDYSNGDEVLYNEKLIEISTNEYRKSRMMN